MPWEVAKGITTTTLLMDIADIGISQVTTTTLRDTGITIVIHPSYGYNGGYGYRHDDDDGD
jgi:hypothetical protein